MLHITRKGDYAIRGMVHLAGKPVGTVCILAEIAADTGGFLARSQRWIHAGPSR
jgi:hypothetical protein